MARISSDDLKVPVGIGWAAALAVLVAGGYPAFFGAYWAIPLTAGVVAAAIGVWRAVRILGMLLDHLHWRDLEVPAGDDPACPACGDNPMPGHYCVQCGRHGPPVGR